MNNNLQVTLERNGKRICIVLRADDYSQSLRKGRMRYGSGPAWTVIQVEVMQ